MKTLVLPLLATISAIAPAQISREQAEARLNSMEAAPPVPRATMIWAMTTLNRDLATKIAIGTEDEKVAAALEAGQRKVPMLYSFIAKALPKAEKRSGKLYVLVLAESHTIEGHHAVEKATKNPVQEIRWAAAFASADWAYRGGHAALIEALQADQLPAVRALARVGTLADAKPMRAYYNRMRTTVTPAGPRPDRVAQLAMAELGDPWALGTLRGEIDHPADKFFRVASLHVLGKRAAQVDIPRIEKSLADPYMNARFAAAEALGAMKVKAAVPALRRLAAKPGTDAMQGQSSEARGRKYASYVADCLEAGNRPMDLQSWNLSGRRQR